MRLCDEYFLRFNSKINYPRHVSEGYIFFDDFKLLSINWRSAGSSIGYYNICESFLNCDFEIENNETVKWNEYESYIKNWKKNKKIILNKSEVFYFIWVFFLRRSQKSLIEKCDPMEVYCSVNKEDPKWMVNSLNLLEKIEKNQPEVFQFWKNKLNNILCKYCHWISSC